MEVANENVKVTKDLDTGGQLPEVHNSSQSGNKVKSNSWLTITLLVIIASLVLVSGYLYLSNLKLTESQAALTQKLAEKEAHEPTFEPEKISPSPDIQAEANLTQKETKDSDKTPTLKTVIDRWCKNNQVQLSYLPFNLSKQLKLDFYVDQSLKCFPSPEGYIRISTTPDGRIKANGQNRVIYFFYDGSRSLGYEGGSEIGDLGADWVRVSINGKSYWLRVLEPDPYGISDLGVWVKLVGEKTDEASQTVVRASNLSVLDEQSVLELVKKYGDSYPKEAGTADAPNYVVSNDKKDMFKKELVDLVIKGRMLDPRAQEIDQDLSGVSF